MLVATSLDAAAGSDERAQASLSIGGKTIVGAMVPLLAKRGMRRLGRLERTRRPIAGGGRRSLINRQSVKW